MKVTLIQPRAGRYNPSYIHEPLGLGYLAAFLKSKDVADVRIIVSAFSRDDADIISQCADSDVVGFTATSPMMNHALYLSGEIKKMNPSSSVVFGGAHSSVETNDALSYPSVDFVIRGEGEETFFDLVSTLRKGGNPSGIYGLSFRQENGKIVRNGARKPIRDLDAIPFPERDLFGQERFLAWGYEKYGDRGAWVVSSRGCPCKCTYCASNRIWTRQWRARSPENILAELKSIKDRYRVDRINFADDTFTISRRRVVAFCRLLMAEKVGISWACNARVDTVDEELFALMKEAGCVEVWMGVESGSPLILKEIKKDISPSQIAEAFRLAKAAGLRTRGYFMIGARSETPATIRQTERLIEVIAPDSLAFSIMTPYPGSEEYDLWKLKHRDEKVDWSRADLFESEAAMTGTASLSMMQLKEEHQRLKEKYASLWRR